MAGAPVASEPILRRTGSEEYLTTRTRQGTGPIVRRGSIAERDIAHVVQAAAPKEAVCRLCRTRWGEGWRYCGVCGAAAERAPKTLVTCCWCGLPVSEAAHNYCQGCGRDVVPALLRRHPVAEKVTRTGAIFAVRRTTWDSAPPPRDRRAEGRLPLSKPRKETAAAAVAEAAAAAGKAAAGRGEG